MGFEKFGKFSYVSQTKIAPMLAYLEKNQIPGTRCKKCKTLHFPPRADCQKCRGSNMEWVPLSGTCTLVTHTEVHFAPPQFQGEAPYLLGLAKLNEGPRVFAPINSKIDRQSLKPGTALTLRVVRREGSGLFYQLEQEH